MIDTNKCSLTELIEHLLSDKHDYRCFLPEYRNANKNPKAIKVYDSKKRHETYTDVYLLVTPSVSNLSNATLVIVYDRHDANSNKLLDRHISTITVSDSILPEMPRVRMNFNKDAKTDDRVLHNALEKLKHIVSTHFKEHPFDKNFQRTAEPQYQRYTNLYQTKGSATTYAQ